MSETDEATYSHHEAITSLCNSEKRLALELYKNSIPTYASNLRMEWASINGGVAVNIPTKQLQN